MTVVRFGVGALGLAGAAYGLVQLLDLGLENLRAAAIWLGGGVVLHDGVLAPATIVVGVAAAMLWQRPLPGPVVVGAVVLSTVTIVAVPVLGRFGARSDNPTLLDRNYLLGWIVLAAVVVVSSVIGVLATTHVRRKGADDGARAGR